MRPTFAQEQGIEPLPAQAALGTISKATTAKLFAVYYRNINLDHRFGFRKTPMYRILSGWWMDVLHRMMDEEPEYHWEWSPIVKEFIERSYLDAYNLVHYTIQHPYGYSWKDEFSEILEETKAAYRVVGDRIVPFASQAEHSQLVQAIEIADSSGAEGAKAHLLAAGSELTAGRWGKAVHESVSAVEAAARFVSGHMTRGLSEILSEMKRAGKFKHPALADGLTKLYAYSSDEQGIRHSLALNATANVDERDAFLLYGLCASFVTYLLSINKA